MRNLLIQGFFSVRLRCGLLYSRYYDMKLDLFKDCLLYHAPQQQLYLSEAGWKHVERHHQLSKIIL
jgi:hypothetical protein